MLWVSGTQMKDHRGSSLPIAPLSSTSLAVPAAASVAYNAHQEVCFLTQILYLHSSKNIKRRSKSMAHNNIVGSFSTLQFSSSPQDFQKLWVPKPQFLNPETFLLPPLTTGSFFISLHTWCSWTPTTDCDFLRDVILNAHDFFSLRISLLNLSFPDLYLFSSCDITNHLKFFLEMSKSFWKVVKGKRLRQHRQNPLQGILER